MNEPTIYRYALRVALRHKRSKAREEHEVVLDAYSLSDACMQLVFELASNLDIVLADFDLTILSAGPSRAERPIAPPEAQAGVPPIHAAWCQKLNLDKIDKGMVGVCTCGAHVGKAPPRCHCRFGGSGAHEAGCPEASSPQGL